MKRKILIGTVLMSCLSWTGVFAQKGTDVLKLSLMEAQDYALSHNKAVINARADVEASKAALWETISAALPQVSLSGTFADNLKLMTTLLPGEFFGQPGTKIPVTFGSQFNTSASMDVSLLLFNAPLYIGIETNRLVQKLSQQSLQKSELDTKESVSAAYFLILVSEKSLQLLEENIVNMNELMKSTRSMFSAGMAESTDVDQMVLNVTQVENSKTALERTIELNYNLLRFQLGVPAGTVLNLTETLESLTEAINVEVLLSQEFDHRQNIDFKLVEGQEMISELTLKSQKASTLPTLAGFYNYGKNGMGDKINDQQWFDNSMVGLNLSVPIFAGGQRYSRIKQAQINLKKARTTKELVAEQLLLQESQLRYNLVNANLQYMSQKDNLEVSKRVYESTENKFRQGMASSIDLTQASNQYLQAESNYLTALMDLLQTKVALDKLLNNI
ncbi:MAG: TolC family protein [Bacteroidales bacterium]|nr:TolC family protein [Bacteroidales bacterium]